MLLVLHVCRNSCRYSLGRAKSPAISHIFANRIAQSSVERGGHNYWYPLCYVTGLSDEEIARIDNIFDQQRPLNSHGAFNLLYKGVNETAGGTIHVIRLESVIHEGTDPGAGPLQKGSYNDAVEILRKLFPSGSGGSADT